MNKKHLSFVIFGLALVGFTYWLIHRPSISADTNPTTAACDPDQKAVVTVLQQTGDAKSASLRTYNSKGNVILSGQVGVVWRKVYYDPMDNHVTYFGAKIKTVDRDKFYGLYKIGKLYTTEETPAVTLGRNYSSPMQYLNLTGKPVSGQNIVSLGSLSPDDHSTVALGLTALDSTTSSQCTNTDGTTSTQSGENILKSLVATGGGQIIYTDTTVQGTVVPVDYQNYQPRFGSINNNPENSSPAQNIPPNKTWAKAKVEVSGAENATIYNFNNGITQFWLAGIARPKGEFTVKVMPEGGAYDQVSSTIRIERTTTSKLPSATYKGVDPLAIQSLQAAGVPLSDITQGLGDATDSKGSHLADPGDPNTPNTYSSSVDITVSNKSLQNIDQVVRSLRNLGWAAWYRTKDQGFENPHIHAVYAGTCKLKAMTDAQVEDARQGRTGLKSHGIEKNNPFTEAERRAIAQTHASPTCSNQYLSDSTVASTGYANSILPIMNMDTMYSSYFGAFFPNSYYGSMPVGHWDVTYDRNNYIPADAIRSGQSGSFDLPITNASPPKMTTDSGPGSGMKTGLITTYGIYFITSPWHDAYFTGNGIGYGPEITRFDYNYDEGLSKINIKYDFSKLSVEERNKYSQWGIMFARIKDNKPNNLFNYNDVIYLPNHNDNLMSLNGEPINAMTGQYGLSFDTTDNDNFDDMTMGAQYAYAMGAEVNMDDYNSLIKGWQDNLPTAEEEDGTTEGTGKTPVKPPMIDVPKDSGVNVTESETVVGAAPLSNNSTSRVASMSLSNSSNTASNPGGPALAPTPEPVALTPLERAIDALTTAPNWVASWFDSLSNAAIEDLPALVNWHITQKKAEVDSTYATAKVARANYNTALHKKKNERPSRAELRSLSKEATRAQSIATKTKRDYAKLAVAYSRYVNAKTKLVAGRTKLDSIANQTTNRSQQRQLKSQQRQVYILEKSYIKATTVLKNLVK